MSRFSWPIIFCATMLLPVVWGPRVATSSADDGKRAVVVPRFGVQVRVPQAWELVDWSRDNTAFVVDVPQDRNSPVGHVTCTVAVAPESLAAYRDEFAADDKATGNQPATKTTPRRKLLKSEFSKPAAPPNGDTPASEGQRLTVEWEFEDVAGMRWYERRVLLVRGGMLYTFTFDSDESHFAAYAADFEEMLSAAKLDRLRHSLEQIAGGYWMQRDYRFAFKLPPSWRPTFGPSDRVLYFAAGRAHGLFIDNLAVKAAPSQQLDLKRMSEELVAELKRRDPEARVSATIVPQGNTTALETVVRTRQGKHDVVVVERRFATSLRNYEICLTCAAEEFDRREKEFREMLDGFIEVPATPRGSDT